MPSLHLMCILWSIACQYHLSRGTDSASAIGRYYAEHKPSANVAYAICVKFKETHFYDNGLHVVFLQWLKPI